MLADKILRMNFLNKNNYVLGFKTKNLRYTIDFMQPFAFLPQSVNNELFHTQRQEILLDNKVKEIKHNNLILNINKNYLSSNLSNKNESGSPELIILQREKGNFLNILSNLNTFEINLHLLIGIVEAQLNRPSGKNSLSKKLITEVYSYIKFFENYKLN